MKAVPGSADSMRRPGYQSVLAQLTSSQKSAKGAPAYSRFVNRRLGRHLAAVAFRLGLKPNHVTGISAGCSAAAVGVLCAIRPAPYVGVSITVLLLVGYALDSADGQLARLTNSASPAGEWLDHMVDCAKIASMHLAVLVSMFRFDWYRSEAVLLLPIGMSVVTSVLFFGMTLKDQMVRGYCGAVAAAPDSAAPSALRSLVLIPTDFGVVCMAFSLIGWATVFLVGYGVLLAAHLVFLVFASLKWFQQMSSLRPGGANRQVSDT